MRASDASDRWETAKWNYNSLFPTQLDRKRNRIFCKRFSTALQTKRSENLINERQLFEWQLLGIDLPYVSYSTSSSKLQLPIKALVRSLYIL